MDQNLRVTGRARTREGACVRLRTRARVPAWPSSLALGRARTGGCQRKVSEAGPSNWPRPRARTPEEAGEIG
eukprot:6180476-Pleurochrysis_carterae.AAC.1